MNLVIRVWFALFTKKKQDMLNNATPHASSDSAYINEYVKIWPLYKFELP